MLTLVAWRFWGADSYGPVDTSSTRASSRARGDGGAIHSGPRWSIVESRNASDVHVLALPLAYIYDRSVLVLELAEARQAVAFAMFLAGPGWPIREVYFIGGGGTDLLSRDIAVESVASERFQIPEYQSLRNAYPTRVRFKEFDFGIYRFVPPSPSSCSR